MSKTRTIIFTILMLAIAANGIQGVGAASPVHVGVLGAPISVGTPFQISFWIDVTYCTVCGTATVYVRSASSYTHLWESSSMTVSGGLDYEANVPAISTPGSYVAGVMVIGPSSGGLPGAAVLGEKSFSVTGSGSASTDWSVLSVSLNPSSPNAGDQVMFSTVISALSSPGAFPQNVQVSCTLDSTDVGSGTISYPGPAGVPMTVSSQTPWIATPGTHKLTCRVTTIPAGLDPDPSNNVMSTTFNVGTPPQQQFDFSISASPSQQTVAPGSSTSYTITVNSASGAQGVDLTLSGTPAGASASFNPSSGTPTFTSTLTISTAPSSPSGTFTITITGQGGGLSHTAQVTLTISQAPDFRIDASPPSQTASQGQAVTYSVNIVALNGFNSQVSLTVSGLPSGGNGVFSNPSATPDFTSTLTITLPTDAPTGSFTLTVTGTGGGVSRVANLILTITQSIVTETTQSTPTNVPGLSDLMGMSQQNPLGIILLAVIILLLVAIVAVALRRQRTGGLSTGGQQTSQPGTKYCPKCGTPNPIGNEFCGKCGQKL